MADEDRTGFVLRQAIEYVMIDGKLGIAPDQIITVSPEPRRQSPEEIAADVEAEAKMKLPKDAAPLVMPVVPVVAEVEALPEPSPPRARASRSNEE